MNPDGWNSKREDSHNQHYCGAIDKKDMIPGGWKVTGRPTERPCGCEALWGTADQPPRRVA